MKFLDWLATAEAMEIYAKAGGSPAVSDAITAKLAADRPDLAKLGDFASAYGFVMTGGLPPMRCRSMSTGQGVHRLLGRQADARRRAEASAGRHDQAAEVIAY